MIFNVCYIVTLLRAYKAYQNLWKGGHACVQYLLLMHLQILFNEYSIILLEAYKAQQT